MNRSIRTLTATLVASLAVMAWATPPAFAADAMSAAPVDCSKASAMMMPGSAMHDSSMHEMTSSGSVDKDFAQMAMSHGHAMVAMAKIEMACGKDAKSKALAQKLLDQASADDLILQDLLKNDSKI